MSYKDLLFPSKIIPHSQPTLNESDRFAVLDVIRSGMISKGEKVAEFESTVASYLGLKAGIATSSGTAALFVALKSLDVTANDEVIIPTYVCHDVYDAVVATGATPVLCDIGDGWNMNSNKVKHCLTSRTKAIVVVYIFGMNTDIQSIVDIGLPIVENIAQSFGLEINHKKVGTFGAITICSFHGTKCLTTGEGGMLLTNDSRTLEKARVAGSITRMSDIQAALGISQITRYNDFLLRRIEIANTYLNALDNLSSSCLLKSLKQTSMFYRFPVTVKQPFEQLRNEFERCSIAVRTRRR